MRRIFRQVLIFLALFCVVSVVFFPFELFSERIIKVVEQGAAGAGLSVEIDKLDIGYPARFYLESIRLSHEFLKGQSFLIDSAAFSPKFLEFLLLRAAIAGDVYIQSGLCDLVYRHWFFSPKRSLKLSADRLVLGADSRLSSLGVNGKLSLLFDVLFQSPEGRGYEPDEITLEASLEKASYRGGHMLMSVLELPAVSDASLFLKADGSWSRVFIRECGLKSSLGNASAAGSFSMDFSTADIDASIELSEQGEQVFGQYLAFAAGTPLDAAGRKWDVRISMRDDKKPDVEVSRSE